MRTLSLYCHWAHVWIVSPILCILTPEMQTPLISVNWVQRQVQSI